MAARLVLESAGLTNPRKQNIHARKRRRAMALLRRSLVRVCGSTVCASAVRGLRQPVLVPPADCELCGGSAARRALLSLPHALAAAGVKHVVIVGGAPASHDELSAAFSACEVRLDLIDGSKRPDRRRARSLASNADVIVIWANTILPRAVSGLFIDPCWSQKTITVSRRGLEVLAREVTTYFSRKGKRWYA
jgi:hypothetical protein